MEEFNEIVKLKHPDEWAKIHHITILDPDGWRFNQEGLISKDYDEIINEKEFLRRAVYSTIRGHNV